MPEQAPIQMIGSPLVRRIRLLIIKEDINSLANAVRELHLRCGGNRKMVLGLLTEHEADRKARYYLEEIVRYTLDQPKRRCDKVVIGMLVLLLNIKRELTDLQKRYKKIKTKRNRGTKKCPGCRK